MSAMNTALPDKEMSVDNSQSASVRALPYMEGVNYIRCYFPHAHGSSFQHTGRVFFSNTAVL